MPSKEMSADCGLQEKLLSLKILLLEVQSGKEWNDVLTEM